MSSSASSSSSRASSPNPEPPKLKRKRKAAAPVEEDGSDSSDSEAESDAEAEPDVPALSHAERRRQKKKAKEQAKLDKEDSKGSATKKRKLADGAVSTGTGTRRNSVWVGNMSFKTTTDNLRTFFDGCGDITRIHMPTKPGTRPGAKPENRGFAYVDFVTPEAKLAAISRSERPLVGRKLLIKDGDDFTGRPAIPAPEGTGEGAAAPTKTHSKTAQKILRAQKEPPGPTLFLGNLGFETTNESIRELLDAHRPKDKPKGKDDPEAPAEKKEDWIRKVRMGTFEDSGLCKGFAFVDFASTEHAESALINPKNHHLNGRALKVEFASANAISRGASKPKPDPNSQPDANKGRFSRDSRPPRRPSTYEGGDGDKGRGEYKGKRDSSFRDKPEFKERSGDAEVKHDAAPPAEGGEHIGHDRVINRKDKGPRSRPKPGAALALAQRQSAAIVPNSGSKKIVF